MQLDLRVHLKTVDLVRETAWMALESSLGWGPALRDLKRAVLWRFAGEASSRQAFMAGLEGELERSSAYYNPNKEGRLFLAQDELEADEILEAPSARPAPAKAAGSLWQASLWVTDEGGERPDLLRRSQAPLAAAGIRLTSLCVGTLWEPVLAAGDAADARGLLAGLALSRSRGEGLLANPHYQEVHLLRLRRQEEIH